MDFQSKLEAIKFIIEADDAATFNIEVTSPEKEIPDETVDSPENVDELPIQVGESQYVAGFSDQLTTNVIYVELCEAVENSCGTGRIVFNGKTLMLNMCQMDNKTTVHMPTIIEGVEHFDTEFEVKIANASHPEKIVLARKK
jgi:hypothetical protein